MFIVIIKAGISAFLASLAFGFLFNIKGKNLWLAGLVGAVGGICYKVGLYYGCSDLLANFIGAVGLSLGSEILARVCKTPVTTFLVCALIPLVPGGGMYRTMMEAIHGDAQAALNMGLSTISIAGVLAIGILLVSTIMRAYYRERRKYLKN
jgi:uncharacterized membrane protein YjjB (DUF3815 family)